MSGSTKKSRNTKDETSASDEKHREHEETVVASNEEHKEPGEVVSTEEDSSRKLDKILNQHIILTGAAGLIPAPILDLASISAIQANMIKEISNHYGVEFKENLCRNIIGALVTGTGAVALGTGVAVSLMKSIPVLGTIGGMFTMPIIAGASTYALGKIFIEHFEKGGTLLDFKPEKAKERFKKEYQEGKKVAADLKDEILLKHKNKDS